MHVVGSSSRAAFGSNHSAWISAADASRHVDELENKHRTLIEGGTIRNRVGGGKEQRGNGRNGLRRLPFGRRN